MIKNKLVITAMIVLLALIFCFSIFFVLIKTNQKDFSFSTTPASKSKSVSGAASESSVPPIKSPLPALKPAVVFKPLEYHYVSGVIKKVGKTSIIVSDFAMPKIETEIFFDNNTKIVIDAFAGKEAAISDLVIGQNVLAYLPIGGVENIAQVIQLNSK